MNIMVIDDDQIILDLFDAGQDIYNYRVVGTASSGEEALVKYPRIVPRPDIVLMDYNLPNMTGIECTKRILQIEPKAKIVFVSAYVEMKDEALASGAIDFIPKPFAMSELIDHLSQVKDQ